LLSLLLLPAFAWLLSENRRKIPWRTVAGGFALQAALALLLLNLPAARTVILLASQGVGALQQATDEGAAFVFGYLGGGPLPFAETHPGASFVLAFKILPLVLVISALSCLLLYLGVLQRVTAAFAWLLRRSLGLDGALALGAATHIFLGMVEAPLLIRPYLAAMSRGELFALMSCGMAGVAGTVMAIYAGILSPVVPDALGAILVASVISTPAALAIGALMVPFAPRASDTAALNHARPASVLDAITRGTAEGVGPLVGIASSLLVTVALVSLVNRGVALFPHGADAPWSLQALLGTAFRPVLWLMGIPWAETRVAGLLMGTKTVLNELVAYLSMAGAGGDGLSPHARLIMAYAMCGFANLGSAGILVGGMGAMVPERRAEIATLGLRSILSGTLATCMSGAWAGLLG
jgi:CNT family concentrative nucleoside transporter